MNYSWLKIEDNKEITTLFKDNNQAIYWHDGVWWFVPKEGQSQETPGAAWLPKGWNTEEALFIGWNRWGQTVIEHTNSKQRYIRRAPRTWVPIQSGSSLASDGLWFANKEEWFDTIQGWGILNLFNNSEECIQWVRTRHKACPLSNDEIHTYYNTSIETLISNENSGERQDPYQPLSKEQHASFVPSGLSTPSIKALQKWAEKHPNESIDEYVQQKAPLVAKSLTAEQVDAVGLAISSIENGSAFLLGDQTGLGKGRVLAAITVWAQQQNLIPVFFTERPALFHDFWRDIEDITGESEPYKQTFMMHQNARITYPNGDAWKNPYTAKARSEAIANNKLPDEVNLIITTYSQFNRKDKNKIDFLKKIAPRAIFLFDEAHNATGQSNIRDAIKAIRQKAKGCIYSSATFGKDASHVSFYTELLGEVNYFHDWDYWLGRNDSEPLRVAVSRRLVQAGRMVRREQDLSGLTYSLRQIPEEFKDELIEKANYFSQYTSSMLQLQNFLNKNFNPNPKHKIDPTRLFGGRLYRLNRLMLMILALPFALDTAKKLIQENIKPVFVCDTTLEQALTDNEDGTIDGIWSSLGDVLVYEMNDLISGWEIIGRPDAIQALKTRQEQFSDWIKRHFSDLPPSPIDALKHGLELLKISVGEVSGRAQKFIFNEDGWIPFPQDDDRVEVVREFNSGKLDSLIATRAGCSGISLHAGKRFKDKRKRELVEWQIPLNVAERIQFFGRVYRKDQVVPSSVSTLVLGLPIEKRGHAWQAKKMQKLFQFSIGLGEDDTFGGLSIDYLDHPKADLWGRLWLQNYPHFAQQMGLTPDSGKNTPWLDRIFSRLGLLNIQQQQEIISFWDESADKLFQTNEQNKFTKQPVHTYPDIFGLTLEGYLREQNPTTIHENIPTLQLNQRLQDWKQKFPYYVNFFNQIQNIEAGYTLKWRDSERRKIVSGRIINLWLPEQPFDDFWAAASFQVWSPELETNTWVSFYQLYEDKNFTLDSRAFSLDAAKMAYNEQHRVKWALKGSPTRLILWKTHQRIGYWNAQDPERLWLPSFMSPERVLNLTIPLGQPVWWLKYLKYYRNEETLTAYDNKGQPIQMSFSDNGTYTLTWVEGAQVEDGPIVNVVFRQNYGNPRRLSDGRMAMTVDLRNGASLAFHLAGRGIFFGIPSTRASFINNL